LAESAELAKFLVKLPLRLVKLIDPTFCPALPLLRSKSKSSSVNEQPEVT
jgi:hypothetical protein